MNLFGYSIGEKKSQKDFGINGDRLLIKEKHNLQGTIQNSFDLYPDGEIVQIKANITSKDAVTNLQNLNIIKSHLISQGMKIPSISDFYSIDCMGVNSDFYLYSGNIVCKIESRTINIVNNIFTIKVGLYDEKIYGSVLSQILSSKRSVLLFGILLGGNFTKNDQLKISDANFSLFKGYEKEVKEVLFTPVFNKDKLIGLKFDFESKNKPIEIHDLILQDLNKLCFNQIHNEKFENLNIIIYESYEFLALFKIDEEKRRVFFEIKYKEYLI